MEDRSQFLKTTGGRVVIIGICYVITLIIVLLLPDTIGMILALLCVYFGWITLDRIQPALFIWMPIIGWVIYIFVKLIIAYIIGLFVAPYKIGNKIFEMIQ